MNIPIKMSGASYISNKITTNLERSKQRVLTKSTFLHVHTSNVGSLFLLT